MIYYLRKNTYKLKKFSNKMGVGVSKTTQSSTQESISSILQQFSAGCSMTAVQHIGGTVINIRGGSGDVNLTQTMSIPMSCIINNAATAIYDLLQDQKNKSAATNAMALLSVNVDILNTQSKTTAIQTIKQALQSKCHLSSEQDMDNVIVNVDNHTGNVNLGQNNSNAMQCMLSNIAGTVNQIKQATQGEQSSGTSSMQAIVMLLMVLAVVAVAGYVGYQYFKSQSGGGATGGGSMKMPPMVPI